MWFQAFAVAADVTEAGAEAKQGFNCGSRITRPAPRHELDTPPDAGRSKVWLQKWFFVRGVVD